MTRHAGVSSVFFDKRVTTVTVAPVAVTLSRWPTHHKRVPKDGVLF